MFDFERALLEDSGPELGVVANYYLNLKKMSAANEPPDETGMLEGQFAVPIAQVLSLLSELVKNEFETIYAYTVYAQTLRDLAHDSIAEHFQDHAEDETEHVTFLLRRMSVLGGPANVPELAPPAPSADPCGIIQTMIRMEQEGIAGWHKLLAVVGDNPMRIKAEEYMVAEQEHLDDLWLLLKPMANPEMMAAMPSLPMPTAADIDGTRAPKADKPKPEKKERSGGTVGKIASAILSKRAEVFTEGTDEPSGDPSDSRIQQLAAKGVYDRTVRLEGAKREWESQGTEVAHQKLSMRMKRAFEEMGNNSPSAAMAGGSGHVVQMGGDENPSETKAQPVKPPATPVHAALQDPALASYLSADLAGQKAEMQQQAAYYKQLADQAQQAAQGTAEQLQMVQQQASDLQQQVQMSQQQIDQAMQQSQQVQQQAMQTAQSASAIAAQSQQAHLQAVNESMMQRQLSEQMRASVAQMKANIQAALQNDPTQGIDMQLGPAGQPPAPMPGQAPTTGGEVQPGGPAGQAPEQELPAGAAPPAGEQPPAQAGSGEAPAMEGAAPSGEVKTSGARYEQAKAKFKEMAPKVMADLKSRAPYAAGGGAVGAGLTVAGHPHSGKTKKKVEEAEGKGHELRAAKLKMHHAVAEYADKHPARAAAMVGAAGAAATAKAGPAVRDVIKGYLKRRKAGAK